jgi:hypothetical protein
MRDHVCDRKGPPAKIVDESNDEPITRNAVDALSAGPRWCRRSAASCSCRASSCRKAQRDFLGVGSDEDQNGAAVEIPLVVAETPCDAVPIVLKRPAEHRLRAWALRPATREEGAAAFSYGSIYHERVVLEDGTEPTPWMEVSGASAASRLVEGPDGAVDIHVKLNVGARYNDGAQELSHGSLSLRAR